MGIRLIPIHALEAKATDICTLPTLDLNEAQIGEAIDVQNAFLDLNLPLD